MGSRFAAVDNAWISEWVVADIVLINPRFELSFWGLEHCMRLFGKRANLPVACLALLAALVPDPHFPGTPGATPSMGRIVHAPSPQQIAV